MRNRYLAVALAVLLALVFAGCKSDSSAVRFYQQKEVAEVWPAAKAALKTLTKAKPDSGDLAGGKMTSAPFELKIGENAPKIVRAELEVRASADGTNVVAKLAGAESKTPPPASISVKNEAELANMIFDEISKILKAI